MPLMTWQLWLAKDLVKDHHLPWQSSQKNLTPGRVAQSVLPLLIEIDTPASLPKTRGKSPGWKTGEKRKRKKTYPIAKKSYDRRKKAKKRTSAVLGVSLLRIRHFSQVGEPAQRKCLTMSDSFKKKTA
ncbi:MAG: hypothetical protein QNJ34_17600 [Xenococcaceae cyanobacterium MO_188.B29]|nr:hypothetical protein [Xenococcaceae cyanobacterium MO_188.B29]